MTKKGRTTWNSGRIFKQGKCSRQAVNVLNKLGSTIIYK
jgi:hypothetical protein